MAGPLSDAVNVKTKLPGLPSAPRTAEGISYEDSEEYYKFHVFMYEIAGSFQLHYQEHRNIGAEKKGFKYLLQRNRLGQTSRKTVGCVLLQLPKSV